VRGTVDGRTVRSEAHAAAPPRPHCRDCTGRGTGSGSDINKNERSFVIQTGKTGFRMLVVVLSGSDRPNEPNLILEAQEVARGGGGTTGCQTETAC
jgi:hypothetical protein